LSLFPWADFRQAKGAVNLNLLLDHDGYLPALFFEVPKQHLKIKTFVGTVPNALKTQIWRVLNIKCGAVTQVSSIPF
jgi:hypothetical protein